VKATFSEPPLVSLLRGWAGVTSIFQASRSAGKTQDTFTLARIWASLRVAPITRFSAETSGRCTATLLRRIPLWNANPFLHGQALRWDPTHYIRAPFTSFSLRTTHY